MGANQAVADEANPLDSPCVVQIVQLVNDLLKFAKWFAHRSPFDMPRVDAERIGQWPFHVPVREWS
jgi:hypothetical protein